MASPSVITAGQSVMLSWNISNATVVKPNWKQGTVPARGHKVLSPLNNTQYTITASNEAGSTQASVTVQVAFQEPPPQEFTVDIPIVYGKSGVVDNTGASATGPNPPLFVGDTFENKSVQLFLSFDISQIRAGAIIKDVKADFSDYLMISGNHFQNLGCPRDYIYDYGIPDAGDFSIGAPVGAIIRYCTLQEMVAEDNEDVKNALQDKVGSKSNRFKIRLQLNTKTDNDDETDMVIWMPHVHYPKMTVTYVTPLQ